jgi:hypothetical protein
MKSFLTTLMFLAVITGIVSLARGFNYLWLTNQEQTVFGDRIKWMHGDTLWGDIRTNSQFSIMGDPVFYGRVISTASDFWRGAGYNPQFLGPPPTFSAALIRWSAPTILSCLRIAAQQQGHYFNAAFTQYEVIFRRDTAILYSWPEGIFRLDNADYSIIRLSDSSGICIFVEGYLRVSGIIRGKATVVSTKQIGISNDIRYVDADSITGITPNSSRNVLGIVADNDIKILNTPANGRNNSNGRGLAQTNADSTDIVITAGLFSLNGSFTFEQQNDPDSGYVFNNGLGPDDRGELHVYGSITQARRGYVHRSSLGSTGYYNRLRHDPRLQTMLPPVSCFNQGGQSYPNDSINFGDVVFGTTRWDTAFIHTFDYCYVGLVNANYPFWADRVPEYSNHFAIPVSFSPPQIGYYSGVLVVGTPEHYFQIPLTGRGVRPPPILSVAALPNPFNATTTIRYLLPEAGAAQIRLYDLLGRTALNLDQTAKEAGEHSLVIDGSKLATGVYFLSVRAGQAHVTQKLLLLK